MDWALRIGCALAGWVLALRPATAAPLNWQPCASGRFAELAVPATGRTGFTRLLPEQTGVWFTNTLSVRRVVLNQIHQEGSGLALGDVDGDGWCDLYLCRQEGPNALYRNLGNWRFEEIAQQAGVALPEQYSTGAALADVDGDGDLDLLVNALGGGTRLFLNDGRGRFTEELRGQLDRRLAAFSMALGDLDGDGDLDLYVTNYRTNTVRSTGLQVYVIQGKPVLRPEDRLSYEFTPEGFLLEHGEPDALYLNDGQGRFTPVSWTDGRFRDEEGRPLTAAPKEWGLSVMFREVNGDGAPDIYVCNDFWSPDRFWINDGRAHFRLIPRLAQRNSCTFSMGIDFADIDRDGDDDFFLLDMLSRDHGLRMRQRAMLGQNFANQLNRIEDRPQIERNALYLNRGDGTYAEIGQFAGVQASEWSWCPVFLDVDLDGFEDILINTGHMFDTQDVDAERRIAARGPQPGAWPGLKILEYPPLRVPRVAFRNRGDWTFEECARQWGFDFVGVAQGIAVADLDNDGDLDVVINTLNGPAGLFRNDSDAPRLAVRLKGLPPNTRGIGAKLRVRGGPVPQSQEMICGGRYLSCDDGVRVFAAGSLTNRLSLEVLWRSGRRSSLTHLVPNRLYEVEEAAAAEPRPGPPLIAGGLVMPFFSEVTRFDHAHHETPFDDFARQSLLSRQLSYLGPGLAWCDLDGDGWDDLVIASGRGGELALLRNRQGSFQRFTPSSGPIKAADDQTAVLAWPIRGGAVLWVGEANYETSQTNAWLRRYELSSAGCSLQETLPGPASSVGPVAAADVDGDGDLDLFAGGRVVPGRYPEPATSRLYRNDGGRMSLAAEWAGLGLVSGAVFSDLNADGLPELILACEWGPLRIFSNERGRLVPRDWPVALPPNLPRPTNGQRPSALSALTGWWNGVATGDFDGDGLLDIVASNWGRNHPWQEFVSDGLRVFYGDLAGRGSVEFLEAYFDRTVGRLVPARDLETVERALPWVRERFPTCAAYGEANVEQVLGARLAQTRELRAGWLDSTLFLNRGDRFEVRPLPAEAQFAPGFGVCVGDSDGDGCEDVFLSQNFFGVEPATSRYDAGRGLWLRGDGHGGLAPVNGQESGVKVYGEQRGAALADFDQDGRLDLVVSQNANPTKLYHNERARPGLRVRLAGPPGNPVGFGAVVQVVAGGKAGPAREVRAGSGYWSQDSPVTVLAVARWPAQLRVRWPGGKVTVSEIPVGAREVCLDTNGTVKRID